MATGDLVERPLRNVTTLDGLGKVGEIPGHRCRKVEVDFATADVAGPKRVRHSLWDIDEPTWSAGNFALAQHHHVLTFQDVERLRRVPVNVQRGPEPRWFFGLEHRKTTGSLIGARLDDDAETVADVD